MGSGKRRISRFSWLTVTVALLSLYFAGFLVFAVLSQRGLVGDGAGYFITILVDRRVFSAEVSRSTADALTQWPLLLALWSGQTNLTLLSWLHSLGLFYFGGLAPLLCWILLPRDRRSLM